MSYAICLKCRTLLKSERVHEFSMCGCENQSFIDGGDEYLRCGGVDMDAILMLTEEEYKDSQFAGAGITRSMCGAVLRAIKQAREQAHRSSGNAGRMDAASIPLTSPIGGGL